MTVYILTADVYEDAWGSIIQFYGAFSSREKAEERASQLKLKFPKFTECKIDEKMNCNLGGYIE